MQALRDMIARAKRVVFFGGAGVSTESGIPDFRSQDGLYRQKFDFPPEVILSHSFFMRHPDIFYRFYREKMLCFDAKPNAAHDALARMEREGKLLAVVTQNIDGLHRKAGSRNVFELHGSIYRNHCMQCGAPYPAERMAEQTVPRCSCGGLIKPDVVLYEEPLDSDVLAGAVQAIRCADALIVGGTSLSVYPAAGLIDLFEGSDLAVINRDLPEKPMPGALFLQGDIGKTLAAL